MIRYCNLNYTGFYMFDKSAEFRLLWIYNKFHKTRKTGFVENTVLILFYYLLSNNIYNRDPIDMHMISVPNHDFNTTYYHVYCRGFNKIFDYTRDYASDVAELLNALDDFKYNFDSSMINDVVNIVHTLHMN